MRLVSFAVVVALTGCASAPVPAGLDPIMTDGAADEFVALVSATDSRATCRVSVIPNTPWAAQYEVSIGEPVDRMLVLTVDDDGAPLRYADVRGDVFWGGGPAEPLTTISLDFERGRGYAFNAEGLDALGLRFDPETALRAESLDSPADRIAFVESTCAQAF